MKKMIWAIGACASRPFFVRELSGWCGRHMLRNGTVISDEIALKRKKCDGLIRTRSNGLRPPSGCTRSEISYCKLHAAKRPDAAWIASPPWWLRCRLAERCHFKYLQFTLS